MPQLGEVHYAKEIGHKGTQKYLWHACADCGKERWVKIERGNPLHLRCRKCTPKGEFNPNWKGGRRVLHACVDCGKERLVKLSRTKPVSLRCRSCAMKLVLSSRRKGGEMAYSWKGGIRIDGNGYVCILLQPDDFFYPMAGQNHYVREHRLVVAKVLGRCLHSWEIVHHKHSKYPAGSVEDKQDNRYPENLQLELVNNHNQITLLENKIFRLQKRIKVLEHSSSHRGV